MTVRGAVVTGGTGALGRQVVRRFVEEGYEVHVPWVATNEVEGFRRELPEVADRAHFRQVDVTSEEQVGAFWAEVERGGGHIDILANMVGGFAYAPFSETDLSSWRRMMELNATSAFLCSAAALPGMVTRGWGRIVNVAAVPAVTGAGANMVAYSAAKAAVLNLTQSLAAEYQGRGITVNAVVPTIIDTPANREAMPEADRSTWLATSDIAGVIALLASDAAGIVTGNALRLAAR